MARQLTAFLVALSFLVVSTQADADAFAAAAAPAFGRSLGDTDTDNNNADLDTCKELKADDANYCFFSYGGTCYSPASFGVRAGEYCSAHAVVSLGALGSVTIGNKDIFCACRASPWRTCRASVEGSAGTGGAVKFYLSTCALAWWSIAAGTIVAMILFVGLWAIGRWVFHSRPTRRAAGERAVPLGIKV